MYKYQVKKTLSALIIASLILQISSPLIAMDSQQTYSKPSLLGRLLVPVLGAIGTGLGLLALKRYQAKKEKVFKETKRQLPKELQNIVGEYALPRELQRDLMDTVKLLPVILRVQKVTFNSALEHALKMLQEKRETFSKSQEFSQLRDHIEAHNKQLHDECIIALHATIITPGDVLNAPADVRHIDLLERQQQNPFNLLIKNETSLNTILGQPLVPGQVALVSYSDGDLKIELTKADRQNLENLSNNQRKFLDSLYATERIMDNGFPTIHFSSSEYWKFYRLFDRSNRDCIKSFYNIVYNRDRDVETAVFVMCGALLGCVCLSAVRLFKLDPCYKLEDKLDKETWKLFWENYSLRCELLRNKLKFPEGVPLTSSKSIGSFTITTPTSL